MCFASRKEHKDEDCHHSLLQTVTRHVRMCYVFLKYSLKVIIKFDSILFNFSVNCNCDISPSVETQSLTPLDMQSIIELYHSHNHDFLIFFSHGLKINVTVAL